MINGRGAVFLEDVIGLSVFLTERIDPDAIMLEELLNLHGGFAV